MTSSSGRTIEMVTTYPTMIAALAWFMAETRDLRGFTFFVGKDAEGLACNETLAAWLWTYEGRTVAYGHIEFSASPRKSGVVRLGVCVLPVYHGQGLGSEVVAYLIAQARKLRQRKIVATVYADNAPMLHIYAKQGFVEEGRFVGEESWDSELRDVVSLAKFL